MSLPRTVFSLLTALVTCTSAVRAQAPASLIPHGDLEPGAGGAKPEGWAFGGDATWESEEGNHFLRITSPQPGANAMLYRAVPIPADARALELRYRVRFDGVKRGTKQWFDGRIMMNFKDAAKRTLSPSPKPPTFVGSSKGWQERSQQFRVPEGAVQLEMMFTLFQAAAGQLDFDDLSLTPIDAKIIDTTEAAAAAKEAARIAALPKPKPQIAVPSPEQLPPPLHVSGNQLLTPDGKPVWLQGVAIPSMEWSAGGEHILQSIEVAIMQWKANCVRLCLGDRFYAGTGPYQNDGGMRYRQLVEDAVNACAGRGAYIVLDLHDYRAPREKHAAFWQEVATRYKNHPAVIFELLNEPHDISWEVWRNGGPVTDKPKGSDAVAENAQPLVAYNSIGMQKLVDTIRATGAQNLIVAGGLDWGYDLSGILEGFALSDPSGHGIVYSSHVYPWKSDWQGKFLALANKYPLFIGEVGADTTPMSFLPPERQEDPATWVPDMLAVIQQHRLNWTAWCFHPKSTPRALLDWDYTPTPFWGEHVKAALAGKKFEGKKLR